jgi:hypothetical protein
MIGQSSMVLSSAIIHVINMADQLGWPLFSDTLPELSGTLSSSNDLTGHSIEDLDGELLSVESSCCYLD